MPDPRLDRLRPELRALLRIAWPLLISNFANVGITVADTILAGRLGATALAAVAVGSSVWMTVLLLGLGILLALGPTVAHHFGAGRLLAIGQETRQALWLALAVSAGAVALCRNAAVLLNWIGIEPHVVILADGYLYAICWGAPGMFLFTALRQMSEGVGRTLPIMAIMLGALPVNVVLNIVFMYGYLGSPALGAVGTGLGSALSYWLMFIALALYTDRSVHYAAFGIWSGIDRLNWPMLRRFWHIGLPIGVTLLMEAGLFGALTLVVGRFGTEVVAAHQVVMNWSTVVFMGPLAFAMAITVRVGQALGRGEPRQAARAAAIGIGLCLAFMCVCAAVTLLLREQIIAVYSRVPAVASIAAGLLLFAAALQPADGMQVACMGALRGYKDTRIPMLMSIAVFWGFGFTLAFMLGVALDLGVTGIWIGLTACIWLQAAVLLARLRRIARRR